MSVYEAAIIDTEPTATVIQAVRSVTDLSIAEARQRISDVKSVVSWHADDYPLDGDREQWHQQILTDIASLRSAGCLLRFQYRPAPGDPAEDVTYDGILNLMQADVDFDNSDHI